MNHPFPHNMDDEFKALEMKIRNASPFISVPNLRANTYHNHTGQVHACQALCQPYYIHFLM